MHWMCVILVFNGICFCTPWPFIISQPLHLVFNQRAPAHYTVPGLLIVLCQNKKGKKEKNVRPRMTTFSWSQQRRLWGRQSPSNHTQLVLFRSSSQYPWRQKDPAQDWKDQPNNKKMVSPLQSVTYKDTVQMAVILVVPPWKVICH